MRRLWSHMTRGQRIEAKLDLVLAQLKYMTKLEEQQVADLTVITREVQENQDAVQSAILLLNQLSELIRQNATDPAALAALADQLNTNSEALAAAIVANTPQEPPPTP